LQEVGAQLSYRTRGTAIAGGWRSTELARQTCASHRRSHAGEYDLKYLLIFAGGQVEKCVFCL